MSDEKPKLTNKQRVFIDEYIRCFNASEAARRAGYSESRARITGSELLADSNISEQIRARLAEVHMSADEALAREAEIGRIGVGFFFKVSDEWMFNPLPEYEILDEREVVDDTKDPPEKRISYRVRHAVLDMDKVIDPRYAHLVKKFTNSRKTGLSIELYDGQLVHNNVLKMNGKIKPDPIPIELTWIDKAKELNIDPSTVTKLASEIATQMGNRFGSTNTSEEQ